VPTLAESGFADFDVVSWYGILAPASTPKDIVARLNTDIGKALADPTIRDRFAKMGIEPVNVTPEQFAATIKTDTARWAGVVKAAGIRFD
jgi:tripartite-type tricarboxylate transporter receptor subunit TctC